MSEQREDYSWSECAEIVECAGVWGSLDEWGEAHHLSSDDVEYINPDLDSDGIVSVSIPMFDSLVGMGVERKEGSDE